MLNGFPQTYTDLLADLLIDDCIDQCFAHVATGLSSEELLPGHGGNHLLEWRIETIFGSF